MNFCFSLKCASYYSFLSFSENVLSFILSYLLFVTISTQYILYLSNIWALFQSTHFPDSQLSQDQIKPLNHNKQSWKFYKELRSIINFFQGTTTTMFYVITTQYKKYGAPRMCCLEYFIERLLSILTSSFCLKKSTTAFVKPWFK